MRRGAATTGVPYFLSLSSEDDAQHSDFPRANPPDDVTIVSWPACVVIVVLLLALFLVLPHF
jgi:hypothetical protein